MTKRRLELLPEVLPRPSTPEGASSVRSRVLARLGVLAALGTVQSACEACSEGYGVVDPIPSPSGGTGGQGGYGVVDPLPPPAGGTESIPRDSCLSVAAPVVSAEYVELRDAGSDAAEPGDALDAGSDAAADAAPGQLTVTVRVDVDFSARPPDVIAAALAVSAGVEILAQSGSNERVSVLLRAPAGRAASIELGFACEMDTTRLRIDLRLGDAGVSVSANPVATPS